MIEIRPYQTKCLDAMEAAAKNGVTRQLIVMATGVGKTVVIGKFLERMGFPNTYGMMHRTELIWQARDRFHAINPTVKIGFDKADMHPDPATDKIILATVQSVGHVDGKRLLAMPRDWPKIVWTDECVSADTLIETASGQVRMDEVTEGCAVVCYNGHRCETRKVLRVFRRGTRKTIQITTASGKALRCTPEHPILTSKGWVPAGALSVGDVVSALVDAGALQSGRRGGAHSHTCQAIALAENEAAHAGGAGIRSFFPHFRYAPAVAGGGCSQRRRAFRFSLLGADLLDTQSTFRGMISVLSGGRSHSQKMSAERSLGQFLGTRLSCFQTREVQMFVSPLIMGLPSGNGLSIKPTSYQGSPQKHENIRTVDGETESYLRSPPASPALRSCVENSFPTEIESQKRYSMRSEESGSLGSLEMTDLPRTARSPFIRRGILNEMYGLRPGGSRSVMGPQPSQKQRESISSYDCLPRQEKRSWSLPDRICHPSWDTNFEAVVSLSEGKDEAVFDLEVEQHHNFFANGILVHNCHHAPAEGYLSVLDHFGLRGDSPRRDVISIGTTATPDRLDELGYDKLFDDVVFRYGLRDGIKDGWLSDIKAWRVKSGMDLSMLKARKGDFIEKDLDEIVNTPEHNKLAVEVWAQHCRGRRSLLFCVTKDHARKVLEALEAAGARAAMVVAETDPVLRQDAIDALKAGKLEAIVNVGVFTEGFDLPEIDCIHILRPTKSRALYVQMIGRGSRKAPGKPYMELFDHTGQGHDVCSVGQIFGLPDSWELDGRMLEQDTAALEDAVSLLGLSVNGLKGLADLKERLRSRQQKMELIRGSLTAADLPSKLVWIRPSPTQERYIISWRNETREEVEKMRLEYQFAATEAMDPKDLYGISERIEVWKNELGKYEARIFRRVGDQVQEHPLGADASLSKLVGRLETWIVEKRAHKAPLMKKSAKWGKEPASSAQFAVLKRKGVPAGFLESGISKREASILMGIPYQRIRALFGEGS